MSRLKNSPKAFYEDMLHESEFKWYPKLTPQDPKDLYCNIQPSAINSRQTLLNLVSVPTTALLLTPDIKNKFELFDIVAVLGAEWHITSISETHSKTVSKELWHKKLSITKIPKQQYSQEHLSNMFSYKNRKSTLKLIKEHLMSKGEELTILEQFELAKEEPTNCILISLEDIKYGHHRGYNDQFIVSIAKIGLRGIGETAQKAIKTFSQELLSPTHNISEQINTSLEGNGINSPAAYVGIETPSIEEFRMNADYNPEYILKMGLYLPYIEGELDKISLPIFSIELETRIKFYDQIRSSHGKFQRAVS